MVNALDIEGVHRHVALKLIQSCDWEVIANQYKWHIVKLRRLHPDAPGGLLVASIKHNSRPPQGHPDNRWFREKYPYQYLGETAKVFDAPRVRGGGKKARRVASKGEKAAAAIVPGGLHYGEKHGALKKEKRQHRDKIGLKNNEKDTK